MELSRVRDTTIGVPQWDARFFLAPTPPCPLFKDKTIQKKRANSILKFRFLTFLSRKNYHFLLKKNKLFVYP